MPIYELWRQATHSDTAATAFLATSLTIIFFAVNAIIQTSSHLIWAFGRDNGLICSKQLSLMHASLGVPVWALIVEEVVVIICGCIYLGSTAAFNALINTAVILQIISFAIPCALLLLRGRSERFLLKGRWFCIPGWLGWVCNGIVVVYAVIELVFFDLPTSIPTTGSSMSEFDFLLDWRKFADIVLDYTCAVLATMAVFSGINWLVYARKHYKGPRIDLSS